MNVLSQSEQKQLVAITAIERLIQKGWIFSGMRIGLGTGSTAIPAIRHLAKKIADGTVTDIKAVSTSFQTTIVCEELGIPVYSLNSKEIGGQLDMAIDGADAISPECYLIKGGGAALLQEKIVAYNAKNYAIVADESKLAESLGTGFPLPVEIIQEARKTVELKLEQIGAKSTLREGVKKAGPVITDNGNIILDLKWPSSVKAEIFEDTINSITGVVDNGFFTKKPPLVFIAYSDGSIKEMGFEAKN
ncbi:MAG: ribose-5-phosphate isomerase RpiA [Spirochaetaceae bacterium]|nr:ribose-5-phosphate isomerase RpiA [Spirochaetaceae bacterium]